MVSGCWWRVVCEVSEFAECAWADVVLDAFCVCCCGLWVYADGDEEAVDGIVALAAPGGEAFALGGELDWLVGLGGCEAFCDESSDGFDDGDVRDAEAFCEVGDAAVALGVDDVRDGFGVVFGEFGGVVAAGALVGGCGGPVGHERV